MPNQRKAGKKVVGCWVEKDIFDFISAEAKRLNVPRSAIAERMIREGLATRGIIKGGK